MRVAYVCADPGVPVFGRKGSSIHVQEVVRGLLARGAQVELFAARIDGEAPADLAGVVVHQLPRLPKQDAATRERAAIAANLDLKVALEAAGPFDLVYERYSLWSYAGMEYARDLAIPGMLEVNAPLILEQANHRSLVHPAQAQQVAERVFGAASALLAVSAEVARYLEQFPMAFGRVHVLPNGVNPSRFRADLQPLLPKHRDHFTVGFVGTLKPWHGLSVLVDAFAQLYCHDANYRLLIVGDGPEKDNLLDDLRLRGVLGAVHCTGAVDPSAVPGLLASMDVAVAPYPNHADFYFSPLKVYEYMAAGLPVVASEIGQLATLIEHDRTGLLCEPGDPVALADAIERLRQQPQLRAQLGREARETMLREHSWDAVVQRIVTIADSTTLRAHEREVARS